jgi:hypothetical protein
MPSFLSDNFVLVLVVVMLCAGGLGGAVNHFFAQEGQVSGSIFGRAMLVGIAAAFMVPLFLNMISSNLLDQIRGPDGSSGDPIKLLVFAGFCLVAAVSSRAFIRTISDRLMSEIKEVKHDTVQAKNDAAQANVVAGQAKTEAVRATATAGEALQTAQLVVEPGGDDDDAPETAAVAPPAPPQVTHDERKVLQAFKESRFVLRSAHGLATASQLPRSNIYEILSKLEARQLVGERMGQKSAKWYITQKGLDALATAEAS